MKKAILVIDIPDGIDPNSRTWISSLTFSTLNMAQIPLFIEGNMHASISKLVRPCAYVLKPIPEKDNPIDGDLNYIFEDDLRKAAYHVGYIDGRNGCIEEILSVTIDTNRVTQSLLEPVFGGK